MEMENKPALLNGNLARAILILAVLAAFVLAAGAPLCVFC